MAEDFHPNYWWNNSASGGGLDRSSQPLTSPPSSGRSDDGAASLISWPSTTGVVSESNHSPGFVDWNLQTPPGKAECSFHSLLNDHDRSTRPFSRLELGESSSTVVPFKEGIFPSSSSSSSPSSSSSSSTTSYMCSSSMLQGLVDQKMDFCGVSNETQQPSWKQFGDAYNPLWINASAGFYPSPLLPPSRTQLWESNSGCRKTGMGLGGDWEERGSRSAAEVKKTRTEAPSAMPATNTVMGKEKLRDRITALQQLVSPFGKTDTASVLQESIDYIKFLHDQVNVLCAPYFKTGRPMPQNQNSDNKYFKIEDEEEGRPDVLRSRGLCLVPTEIIYPAESESIATTSEFWTPIHGRTYW